jgi:hypothetical protein
MKGLKFARKKLRGQEWLEFYLDFRKRAEYFGVKNLDIEALFAQFIVLLEKADDLLVILRKSVYTKELETADRERDTLFRGFYGVVIGLRAQPDAAKQKAAKDLCNLLDGYKKLVLEGNLAAESGAIHNLLQDLRGKYAADMTLLELTYWVTAIDKAEKDFLELRGERTEESVEKPKEDLKQLRNQVDILYNAMMSKMDIQLLADGLGGDIVVDPKDLDNEGHFGDEEDHHLHGNIIYNFIIAWNEEVKKYRNLLAQRSGHHSDKPETEDPEDEDPED